MVLVYFLCHRMAWTINADLEETQRKLREAEQQSRDYAARLESLNAELEQRVLQRTAQLAAGRDRLEQVFTVLASLQNPDTADKTFDLVLGFCQKLGYDQAMLSLVERDAHVIRAVKAVGSLTSIVARTVRPLQSGDILALVARERRTVVIPDSTRD